MLRKTLSFLLNFVLRLFPVDNKKIVFTGTKYHPVDNPYYVYKYLKTHQTDYKLIFIVSKDADVSVLGKNDYVYVRSLKSFYHLATYKYLFTCQSFGSIIKKRPEQMYIQFWHGIAFKKMGLDMQNPNNLTQDPHTFDWEWFVTSSEYDRDSVKSAYGYKCPSKILGTPRTDAMFQKFDCEKIKEKLGITGDKKIILYAPTFRDNELSQDMVDIKLPLSAMDDFTLLVRLHPEISEKVNPEFFRKNSNIINVCNYPNSNDLLAISDVLITDYSSIFFDFSLLNKMTIFYAYDLEEYISMRKGFYLDYKKDLPGPVAYNEKELEDILLNIDSNISKYKNDVLEFNKSFNSMNDGNVCSRILEELQNGGFEK